MERCEPKEMGQTEDRGGKCRKGGQLGGKGESKVKQIEDNKGKKWNELATSEAVVAFLRGRWRFCKAFILQFSSSVVEQTTWSLSPINTSLDHQLKASLMFLCPSLFSLLPALISGILLTPFACHNSPSADWFVFVAC